MKLKIYSFYSKIISFCLVLLGFNACGDDTSYGPAEYGVPSAKYKVSGKVVSSDLKVPIDNVRVVMIENAEQAYLRGDTLFTDIEGKFEINRFDFPHSKYKVKFQDIDGEENGFFEDIEEIIEFKDSDYKDNNGGWYRGEATKDMGTIELNPKQEE